jgi:hypothetical protein
MNHFLPFEQLEIILIKGFQGRSVVPVLKAVEEMGGILKEGETVVFNVVMDYADMLPFVPLNNFNVYEKLYS